MGVTEAIQFTVNGRIYEVQNPEFGVSLNSWLRTNAKLTGTKVMCAEGGCGACVVTVTRNDPVTSQTKSFAANSCLLPLLSVDGWHITTTEGLIEDGGTYNAIQERVAHFNATQCGYCTPGFVMTMHSLLQRNPNPSQAEIESEFDGNICRCTGYRPIFDAMKSFASDADPKLKKICADIEDLKSCRENCKNDNGRCYKSCGRYKADGSMEHAHKTTNDATLLRKSFSALYRNVGEQAVWIRPLTLTELTDQVKEFTLNDRNKIRFVVGNTSTGVYKDEERSDVYIDTKEVKEIYEISNSCEALKIGANVSLSDLIVESEKHSAESEIFSAMAEHIKKIANVPVRNVGSWAGNLMIKKLHPEFPSDMFTLFSAFNVTITVRDCITGDDTEYMLTGQDSFMKLDMTGKVILACTIPKTSHPQDGTFKALSYKVMPRAQNAHAYVNSAFTACLVNGFVQSASLSFGGISKEFARAENTEKYLEGKKVNDQATLLGALEVLRAEVQPESYSAVASSPEYRISLVLGLFYKFFLYLQDSLPHAIASAVNTLDRPVTSSTRTYDSDASMFPITEPMPKLSAIKQASGEAKYVSDMTTADELCATYVMAEIGNADIDVIDTSVAKTLPGFHSIITAADLPAEVQNTYIPPPFEPQVIVADGHVDFAGQPVAIVIADSEYHAEEIAKKVFVTYKNRGDVICNLAESIEKEMFYEGGDHFERGNASEAMKNATHKISGRAKIGSQYHFYMEPQTAKATPTEDGYEIRCGTQWQDGIQKCCAYILGWDNNRVNVRTGRIGGAYGGKAVASWLASSIAMVASYVSGRPVRFYATLSRCIETFARRSDYIVDYNVGVDADGMLQAIEATYYANNGVSPNYSEYAKGDLAMFSDSGYQCPNWSLTAKNARTHMSSTFVCRAPISAQSAMFMEIVLEHVANTVNQEPIVIKQKNLYQKEGHVDLGGIPLNNFKLREIAQNLLASANAVERQKEVDQFNKENKWKKRGLGFVPLKYLLSWQGGFYPSQTSIYAADGSVILSTGATDCGQGISTKLIQVASYVLGAPIDLIRLSETSVIMSPNSGPSGRSITSEISSQGMLECCKILKARLDETAAKLKLPKDTTWKDKIAACFAEGVDLTSTYWIYPKGASSKMYNICGAAMSEVEMDILTGEYALKKVDILYDCGKSVSPEIDIGQAEGAFMFGVGYYTTEKITFDPETGKLLTNNTWEYKPPSSKDIPTEWNITFLKDESNPKETLSSKAVGEPPLLLSSSVVFAIKRCIESFRNDGSYFAIDLPATVDNVQQLCDIAMSQYKLND